MIDYQNRKTGIDSGVGGEIVKSLTEFEKKLVEEQDVVEIRGKVSVMAPKFLMNFKSMLCLVLANSLCAIF